MGIHVKGRGLAPASAQGRQNLGTTRTPQSAGLLHPSLLGSYTPVCGAPTPQSARLLHPSLRGFYTPVCEAPTPQSDRLLHPVWHYRTPSQGKSLAIAHLRLYQQWRENAIDGAPRNAVTVLIRNTP